MSIRKDVTGSFHEQFEVLYELQQMKEYDVTNQFDMIYE
jgi:hypothetical protein